VSGVALLSGLSAIALGGICTGWKPSFQTGLVLQAIGSALLGLAGFLALGSEQLGSEFSSGMTPTFGVDGLSGFFIGVLGLVATAALTYSMGYLQPSGKGRAIGSLTAVFILALTLVFVARNPLMFLTGWELITLCSAAVIMVYRAGDRIARRSVFTYLSITHLGGVGTWIAVLLLMQAGAIGDPTAIEAGSGLQIAIALMALIGMGTKAGVMPLHVWLPRAHPIAPAPISALMSGVMIKVAIYALIRILVEWVGLLPLWIGILVMAIGAFSAIGGILYALFQRDLKGLLAFSSIENIGIIMLGLGACLTLRTLGVNDWAGFALAAALLHTLNHAVFKALLFLGAGAFERAVGSLQLDRLGGLLKRMPWSGGCFLLAGVAIAGLPPFNGFVSEWLTLQALIHIPTANSFEAGIAAALALLALAATAALAVFCFVKVIGLVLLGSSRSKEERMPRVTEPFPMRCAMVVLAVVCVILGLAPGLLFNTLVGLAPWSVPVPAGSDLGLALPSTGSLSTVGLGLILIGFTTGLLLLGRNRRRVAKRSETWVCGQAVEPQLRWTSAGFTKPVLLVVEALLRPQRTATIKTRDGVDQEAKYRRRIPNLIDERIYRPLTRWSLTLAAFARRLQSGSLSTYVTYLIGTMVFLLTVAKLGVIG
jgi:hydrogenase-4 component B